MTTAQTTEFDRQFENNNMSVGIITDAPKGEDPLTYNYVEEMDLGIFVSSLENPDQIATIIEVSVRVSSFENEGELRLSLNTIQESDFFEAELWSISIGQSKFAIKSGNITSQVYTYQLNGSSSINFEIRGQYPDRIKPNQVSSSLDITFNSLTPKQYEVGAMSMDDWDEILPLMSAEYIVMPLIALGAAVHIALQSKSTAISTAVSTGMDQAKKSIKDTKADVDEFTQDHEEAIDAGRRVKEGTEFGVDVYKVDQELGKDQDTSWLTWWAKVTFGIYLVLLLVVSSRLFYIYPEPLDTLLISIYTGYTALYMSLLLFFFISSFVRPVVIRKIGGIVPTIHVLFIIFGILIFIIFPLSQVINIIDPTDIQNWSDTLFISLISMGFVVTSLFAGYYLGRSGTSWAAILDGGLNKLKFPRGFRRISIRLLTVVFFFIVLVRLGRRLALGIAILTNGQLASNAYLVSLAASYLKDEATGSIWIVYGLIMIFFIQSIMAIFLHLNKEKVTYDMSSKPVYVAYRRLALLLLIAVLSFIHLILLIQGKISELGLNNLVYPEDGINTQDVFNVLFVVPPFKILLDILLALGLVVTLPSAIKEMWSRANQVSEPEQSESDHSESEQEKQVETEPSAPSAPPKKDQPDQDIPEKSEDVN